MSRISSSSVVCSTADANFYPMKHQSSILPALCEELANRFHHKGPIIWKAFTRHPNMQQYTLQGRHNGLDGVSNHQSHHCLLSRLFGRRSKKTSKLRVTGLCAGNSPGTGEFPTQMASNAENVSI